MGKQGYYVRQKLLVSKEKLDAYKLANTLLKKKIALCHAIGMNVELNETHASVIGLKIIMIEVVVENFIVRAMMTVFYVCVLRSSIVVLRSSIRCIEIKIPRRVIMIVRKASNDICGTC